MTPQDRLVSRSLPGSFWLGLFQCYLLQTQDELDADELDAQEKLVRALQLADIFNAAEEGCRSTLDDVLTESREQLKEMTRRLGVPETP